MHVLADLFITHSVPGNSRSDKGLECIAKSLRKWLQIVGVQTQYIQLGSPWEKGYCESFNGKLRSHFLDGEIFTTLQEAKILIEAWRKHYNTRRPHRSLGGRPPAPLTVFCPPMGGHIGRLTPTPEPLTATRIDRGTIFCH